METPLGKSVSETPAVTAEVDYQSATLQEACDALNNRNDGQSYSVSGDGKAISIRMNTTGTSHVEIVSTPLADMTREELIARCELLDRLSDEQIELNERRDEWWNSMRIQFEGATFRDDSVS